MCGILGYLGKKNGTKIVQDGLKALSYRGYDSWGIAVLDKENIVIHKETGDITKSETIRTEGKTVIGHTRWATHGGVTERNAHPHTNSDLNIAVVHNGIIENYNLLKDALQDEGYVFTSETDTEVIPHLIDYYMKHGKTFEKAFERMLKDITGSYAILAMHTKEGMMFARNGSPLLLGIGDGEYFISSDIPSFIQHTKQIMHLEDGDYGHLGKTLEIYNFGKKAERKTITAHWDVEIAKKGNYPHFMIKEIEEQPLTIRKALNQPKDLIDKTVEEIKKSPRIYLVGCGTSYNTCSASANFFSNAGKQAIPVIGSEFEQQKEFITENTPVFAVSQSGETADVIDAIKSAKEKKAKIIAIVNAPSSTIARLADIVIPMNCGPELCVLSTKSCTSQLAILALLAYTLEGKDTGVLNEAADISFHVLKENKTQMKELAKKIARANSMFVIGRGALSSIAREAALKIKEVSYIHAEGMSAGELKHGTIAVIEEGMPVITFADSKTRHLMTSSAMEVRARGAFVIGVDSKPSQAYDVHIQIPEIEDATMILAILPIQLLSYCLALERKCDPDKPRNLAKSVTVR